MTPGDAAVGGLSICATPIGNRDDITLRVLRTLKDADLVLAEDTRRTGALLAHHGIAASMRAFHAHSPNHHIDEYVRRVREGEQIALVSDAGTPLISDPGARLAEAVREAGLPVTAAPGPSAVLTALTVAGLRADRFRFIGFLPRQASKRDDAIHAIGAADEATVLFESPRRVHDLLSCMVPILGLRRIAVCRELTKRFEEVRRGTAKELAEIYTDGARGEVTVVVEGQRAGPRHDTGLNIDEFIRDGLESGTHPRELAKELAQRTKLSRKAAYEQIVSARQSERQQGVSVPESKR